MLPMSSDPEITSKNSERYTFCVVIMALAKLASVEHNEKEIKSFIAEFCKENVLHWLGKEIGLSLIESYSHVVNDRLPLLDIVLKGLREPAKIPETPTIANSFPHDMLELIEREMLCDKEKINKIKSVFHVYNGQIYVLERYLVGKDYLNRHNRKLLTKLFVNSKKRLELNGLLLESDTIAAHDLKDNFNLTSDN